MLSLWSHSKEAPLSYKIYNYIKYIKQTAAQAMEGPLLGCDYEAIW
jgi:hypothetical protein